MAERVRVLHGQYWGEHLAALLQQPPVEIAQWLGRHSTLVKNDAYSMAGLLELEGKPCFVKLYRHKSLLRKWLPPPGGRRAVRSFMTSQVLADSAVPVPAALACLMIPEGLLLLTESIVQGTSLGQLWHQAHSPQESGSWMRAAGDILAALHQSGFVHGDCKWSNLLWSDDHFYLVDLDAARKATWRVHYARDIARFTLNAEEQGVEPDQYEQFLSSYLQSTGGSREALVTGVMPYLKTFRERHRVRYGDCGSPLL